MDMQSINSSIMSFVSANPFFIVLIVWSIVWKLIAMWKAARNGHMTMFIVIAFLNTPGLLEIGYLLWLHFRTKKEQKLS